MNRRTIIVTTAVLGIVLLGLGAASITSNAADVVKPGIKTAPIAPPPAMPQINETQQLRMQIQRLETQVSQLSSDLASLRSQYDSHTHGTIGMSYTGTYQLDGSTGFSLRSGGPGARIPSSEIKLSRPQKSNLPY